MRHNRPSAFGPFAEENMVPLTAEDLDLLAWYAAWTPKVHRADWPSRKLWPPGFRAMADMSVHNSAHAAEDRRTMSVSVRRDDARRIDPLLAWEMLEGDYPVCRLAPRGRAALLLAGRPCPDAFEPHADVFDSHSLLPSGHGSTDWRDTPEGRLLALHETRTDGLVSEHTSTWASAIITSSSSTGTPLNGSIREHARFLSLDIRNRDHDVVCAISLSFEQLAELLTTHSYTPVTVNYYRGDDGMRRSEPAPPPVSVMDRARARLRRGDRVKNGRLDEIRATVEAASMGVKLKKEILDALDIVKRDNVESAAYVSEQIAEEASSIMESARIVVADRLASPAGPALAAETAAALGLPPIAEEKT